MTCPRYCSWLSNFNCVQNFILPFILLNSLTFVTQSTQLIFSLLLLNVFLACRILTLISFVYPLFSFIIVQRFLDFWTFSILSPIQLPLETPLLVAFTLIPIVKSSNASWVISSHYMLNWLEDSTQTCLIHLSIFFLLKICFLRFVKLSDYKSVKSC